MQQIVASAWKHDSELGRGYLLVSQAHGNGRIWRWEVGGGPIAIGRTLHLEDAGCRSKYYRECSSEKNQQVGSGGMAIDFHSHEHCLEGALVVAEWGEGRIVRMEDSNGARTPLIVQVPNICEKEKESEVSMARLYQPKSMLYTPFGDLLVADTNRNCQQAAIYRLPQAVHVEALESLTESRQAHAWNDAQHGIPVEVFYQDGIQSIGGMAMDTTWLNMLVTIKDKDGNVLLIRMPIASDDDDDDDEEEEEDTDDNRSYGEGNNQEGETADERKLDEKSSVTTTSNNNKTVGIMDKNAQIVLNMSQELGMSEPGPIAVSEKGHIFAATPRGIAILQSSTTTGKAPTATVTASLLGYLPTPNPPPTSLTIGEDKFLYSFSDDSLFRVRIRLGPVNVPTNLVVGKRKSTV